MKGIMASADEKTPTQEFIQDIEKSLQPESYTLENSEKKVHQ